MTTSLKEYPTRIAVHYKAKKGMIAIDQIRTVDKRRIIKSHGKLDKNEIKITKEAIKETFVD